MGPAGSGASNQGMLRPSLYPDNLQSNKHKPAKGNTQDLLRPEAVTVSTCICRCGDELCLSTTAFRSVPEPNSLYYCIIFIQSGQFLMQCCVPEFLRVPTYLELGLCKCIISKAKLEQAGAIVSR